MFAVDLADLLTVRRKQRHRHIYATLGDHHLQILTGDHRDLVGMRLTTRQFSFNGLTGFQRISLLSALRRAALASGSLRRRRPWPRACSSRLPSLDEQVDHERGPAD